MTYPTSLSMMPAPFAWIEIPGGHGTMLTNEVDVMLEIPSKTYWMSKYPITNAQFAKFIEAGGYQQEKWWTARGWEKRQENDWTIPRYRDNNDFNGAEQPVVEVTWFEAVAFCLWLRDVIGENIMLPTEAQWQYAAQGNDGRAYPWGNEWDGSRCNNSVSPYDSYETTPVTQYQGANGRLLGESPFGVVGMAGNVWEWCLTDYNSGNNNINGDVSHVVRGGSWLNENSDDFRCDYRVSGDPDYWIECHGFRVALS